MLKPVCLCLWLMVAAGNPTVAQTIVFPTDLVATQGLGGANESPFATVGRMQQIELQSKGVPLVVGSIAARRGHSGSAAPEGLTLQVSMGEGDARTFGQTFASNWASAPTVVFAARPVNWGGFSFGGLPGPFAFSLPLDAPFVFSGQRELLWEVVGRPPASGGSSLAFDTDQRGYPFLYTLGQGCRTSASPPVRFGGNVRILSTATVGTRLSASGFGAPPNVPVHLMLGLTDPDAPLAGLCTNLRTDASLAVVPIGTSDGLGRVEGVIGFGSWQASWVGVSLFAQFVAPDAANMIPVTLSNGTRCPIPDKAAVQHRVLDFNPDATAANSVDWGFGAVIQLSSQ